MKRFGSFLLAFVMALSVIPWSTCNASESAVSTFGDNITWRYDQLTNTLTISGEGEMESRDHCSEYPWHGYSLLAKSLIIEEGVTNIPVEAFCYFDELIRVSLPEGLESIGASAFYGCEALRTVNYPESLKFIGCAAFAWCTALWNVELPQGLETLECHAFNSCKALRYITLPDSLTVIEEGVFGGCRTFSEILLPGKLEKIGKSAFFGCRSLKEIHIPQGVTTIEDDAFSGCTALTELVLPETMREIPDRLCHGCTGLERVVLPIKVESIGYSAFADCENLSAVENYSLWVAVEADSFLGTSVSPGIRLRCFLKSQFVIAMIAVMCYLGCMLLLNWLWNRAGQKVKRLWGILLGICGLIILVYIEAMLVGDQWQSGLLCNEKSKMAKTYRECAEVGIFWALVVFSIGAYQYFVGGAWLRAAQEIPRASALAQALIVGVNLFILGGFIHMAWQTQLEGWEDSWLILRGCFWYRVKSTEFEYFLVPIAGMILGWAALILFRCRESKPET